MCAFLRIAAKTRAKCATHHQQHRHQRFTAARVHSINKFNWLWWLIEGANTLRPGASHWWPIQFASLMQNKKKYAKWNFSKDGHIFLSSSKMHSIQVSWILCEFKKSSNCLSIPRYAHCTHSFCQLMRRLSKPRPISIYKLSNRFAINDWMNEW